MMAAGYRFPIAVFGAFTAAVLALEPSRTSAQAGESQPLLPDVLGVNLGETTLLKSGFAHSLVYDSRKVEPVPPGAELKAFQMERERGIELVSLYRKAAPAVVVILAGG